MDAKRFNFLLRPTTFQQTSWPGRPLVASYHIGTIRGGGRKWSGRLAACVRPTICWRPGETARRLAMGAMRPQAHFKQLSSITCNGPADSRSELREPLEANPIESSSTSSSCGPLPGRLPVAGPAVRLPAVRQPILRPQVDFRPIVIGANVITFALGDCRPCRPPVNLCCQHFRQRVWRPFDALSGRRRRQFGFNSGSRSSAGFRAARWPLLRLI